jgi:hypothetical protein
MGEIEASIQAQLQAKLNSGASKEELLAQAGNMDLMMAPAPTNDAQDVIASVLAKHNVPVLSQKPMMAPALVQIPAAAPAIDPPVVSAPAAAVAVDDNKAS